MKKAKSISLVFLLSIICSVQVFAFALRPSVESASLHPFDPKIKAELSNTPQLQTKRLIEVESQPWGIGMAILFTTLGVMVMKYGTPSPTFLLHPRP